MRRLPLFLLILFLLAVACTETEGPRPKPLDGEKTPTMVTDSVNTFISDSGITRYHVRAPKWLIYDEAKEPYWLFPGGVDMQRYDDQMTVDATIVADTATYFSRKKLWRLDGNVRLRNIKGDKFLTQQLFWDQERHTVYSDSFIHIERAERILEGYGFTSNEQITNYTIRRPTAIIPTSGFDQRNPFGPGGAVEPTFQPGADPQAAPRTVPEPEEDAELSIPITDD